MIFVASHPPGRYVYSDMQGYVDTAVQVAKGGPGLRRTLALSPPGTHLLLAAPFKLFGTGSAGLVWADAMWVGFSALLPVFAWRLVRLLLGAPAAAITAALCAVYPLFILYTGFFTSEVPSLALLSGALWLGYRAGRSRPWAGMALGAGGGLLAGALVATRPQFLLNVGLVVLFLVRRFRATWRAGLAFGLTLVAVLSVVVVVNSRNAGRLTGLSENSGIQFYQAQCPVHTVSTGHSPGLTLHFQNPVSGDLQRGRNVSFPNHLGWDSGFFLHQGLRCIGQRGLGQILMVGRNLADLTVTSIPWPLSEEIGLSRIGDTTNILYCGALLGALLIMWRLWRRHPLDDDARWGTGTLLAHLAMIVPVTVIFGSEPRYRVPYDLFGLALLAWLIARRVGGEAHPDAPEPPGRRPPASAGARAIRRRSPPPRRGAGRATP